MRPLDDELRSALKRREPPAGFAERVMARLAGQPGRVRRGGWAQAIGSLFRMPKLRWVAVGAAVCLLLVVGAVRYQRRERAQGELAKEQLKQALHIASSKLNLAKKRVQEADHRSPES